MGRSRCHVPIRTCISCGSKGSKKDLIRLIPDMEGRLMKDLSGSMHGRGAYVCVTGDCLERLSKNKRLNRIFRTKRAITVGPELLVNNKASFCE
jgi:predicted RNA-binding protein YlxR (DUF448 family)